MGCRNLALLVAPRHTAVVTQECQGAVVGRKAGLAELATETGREALPNLVRLLPVARQAGARVVHCLSQRRADGLGANRNARLFAATVGLDMDLSPGSPGLRSFRTLGLTTTDELLDTWSGERPGAR